MSTTRNTVHGVKGGKAASRRAAARQARGTADTVMLLTVSGDCFSPRHVEVNGPAYRAAMTEYKAALAVKAELLRRNTRHCALWTLATERARNADRTLVTLGVLD